LDDVVKTCLSTVKYPGVASSSNQVLELALMNCKHFKLCFVLDCYEIVLGMLKIYWYAKNIIYMKLRNLSNPSKKFFSSKLNLDALQLVFSPCDLGQ